MSDIKNVIVVGAGGNLGPYILEALLASSFNTSILSREGSSSTFPAGVKVQRVDYDAPGALKTAFTGQDAVILVVGGTALGDQQKFIDAAIAAGVKRFFPTEYGSDTQNPELLKLVPLFNAKKGAVDYLKSKEDSISWTGVATGPFFDWGLKVGFLGFNAATKTATFVDDGKSTFSGTNLRQIGETVVKALEKAEETKNKYIFVTSFQISQAELLPIVEKVSGEKWTVEHVTSKQLLETGNEKISRQDFSGVGELIRAAVFGSPGLGNNEKSGLWNDKLGLKKEDLEESVKAGLSGNLLTLK